VLVALSAAAALGLVLVPDDWVGLLGLVPIGLGVRGLVAAIRSQRRVVGIVERFGHWLVPAVFITIGVIIVAESGVAGRLIQAA
jgi:cadmium resistance protein CadD (predicted permease)